MASNILEDLADHYPEFRGDYTPPWGLPTVADLESIAARYGCHFPPSYIRYCTQYASRVPVPDNAFVWASAKPDQDAYASLKATLASARTWGVPDYLVPFWEDESNFLCFDSRNSDNQGEFPIVFWEHDFQAMDPGVVARTFVDWLIGRLEAWRKKKTSKESQPDV